MAAAGALTMFVAQVYRSQLTRENLRLRRRNGSALTANVIVQKPKAKLSLEEKIDLLLAQQFKTTEELQKNNCLLEAYRAEISELKTQLQERDVRFEQLQEEFRELQQQSRARFVEIQNMPMLEDEDEEKLAGMAVKTFETYGVELDESEVEGCHRVLFKKSSTPGPVVVELSSRKKALDILKKRKKEVYQADIIEGESKEVKLFINESLSKPNRELLYETKKMAKAKGLRFVWVKNGKVFVRKDKFSEIIRIRALSQVGTVEGDTQCF